MCTHINKCDMLFVIEEVYYIMSTSEKQKQSVYKYKLKNIKRVPLDMQKSDYEKLADAAAALKMSVNGYIKEAIAEKMKRERLE